MATSKMFANRTHLIYTYLTTYGIMLPAALIVRAALHTIIGLRPCPDLWEDKELEAKSCTFHHN